MGFTDLLTDAGLAVLNSWVSTRSYIVGYSATQADVTVFKTLKEAPNAAKYPSAARWYKHVATFEDEFATLEGDAGKPYTVYGPEVAEVTLNPAKAPAAEDDDDVDLFGSDDEEEDAEAARIRAERLADYHKKKQDQPKPVGKSIWTMDIKPMDDETDLDVVEAGVRTIQMDGLVWGTCKKVPVGYGIHKLQMSLVVPDDLLSDDIQQAIEDQFGHWVQSTDVIAMQKL
ncbi:EF-1 guanine nucleotide exchange domain-containing protein [Trichoderma sp. SZMC 28014]